MHTQKQQSISFVMISYCFSIFLKVLFNIIFLTCRWVVINKDILKKNKNKPLLICLWHSRLVYFSRFFKKQNHQVWAISSTHKDSEILARILNSWGIRLIKGSSTRGFINVIKQMKRLFKNDNATIAVTVDGPKGPAKIAKEGSIKLAHKNNVSIVAAAATASSFWELPSWDKTKIPKPFSTIYVRLEDQYLDRRFSSSDKISTYINNCFVCRSCVR